MHELGIVHEVIRIVDGFVATHQLTYVDRIVLEIGALSQAIPRFIEECYPAAVSGTAYEGTALEIITVPAVGRCRQCQTAYDVVETQRRCPKCGVAQYDLLCGQEFNIKEIVAR